MTLACDDDAGKVLKKYFAEKLVNSFSKVTFNRYLGHFKLFKFKIYVTRANHRV